jgi:hypothetical protein
MMRYLTIPGWTGSDVGHWQSHWERDEHNVYLTAGTLDDPSGIAIKNHIFYGSRSDWDRDAGDVRYFVERSTGLECDR